MTGRRCANEDASPWQPRSAMAPDPGLCKTCAFARVVESAKGSAFWLCRRSETDARFRKYPPLPVLECVGYEEAPPVSKR